MSIYNLGILNWVVRFMEIIKRSIYVYIQVVLYNNIMNVFIAAEYVNHSKEHLPYYMGVDSYFFKYFEKYFKRYDSDNIIEILLYRITE